MHESALQAWQQHLQSIAASAPKPASPKRLSALGVPGVYVKFSDPTGKQGSDTEWVPLG